MQKDTSERVVLLFDPERNELKNSLTKKKFTDVAKFLLITDMSVGLNFTNYQYLYLIVTDY